MSQMAMIYKQSANLTRIPFETLCMSPHRNSRVEPRKDIEYKDMRATEFHVVLERI